MLPTLMMIEIAASLLALVYLILATMQQRLCWVFSFVSALLFVPVFWSNSMPLFTVLQFYFAGMAIYGWVTWAGGDDKPELPVQTLTRGQNGLVLVILAALIIETLVVMYVFMDSATPLWLAGIDSTSTWASIAAMALTARKYLESWLLWLFLVNLPLVVSCVLTGLFPTAALYAAYAVMSVFGYFRWRGSLASA
ncbi:MAG: nicotinamide mononucleotide transporter [Gammaproteobacteria bacterium AqS3]|nr:nicotinamide mononucleotide transporter [Gammaproteobacteria bacterium AqS3]